MSLTGSDRSLTSWEEVRGPLVYYGGLLLVVLAAFWTFRDIPGFFFTKMETSRVLASSRVDVWTDILRILTSRVEGAVNPRTVFYRPVFSLSMAFNSALSGVDPFGYHLVNLLLHMGVAGLLFRIVYMINDRDVRPAVLAGVLYALHPLTVEVIPAVNHRQQTLMALFLLVGFWSFLHREYGKGGPWSLAGALAFFLLALGSKESGIFFLPLVLGHLLIFNPEQHRSWWQRAFTAGRRGLPYVFAAAGYVGWWAYVTEAEVIFEGGNFRAPIVLNSWTRTLRVMLWKAQAWLIPNYFRAIFYPFLELNGFLWSLMRGFFLGTLSHAYALSGAMVTVLLAAGSWFVKVRGFKRSSIVRLVLVGLLVSLASFPLYGPAIDGIVEDAYHERGHAWLTGIMESRDHFPLEHYRERARKALVIALTGVLFVAFLIDLRLRPNDRDALTSLFSPLSALVFYGWWLVVPALFYVVVGRMNFKHSFHGILPLSALLGTFLVAAVDTTVGSRARRLTPFGRGVGVGTTLVLMGLAGSIVWTSPLIQSYPTWKHSQAISRLYYGVLVEELKRIPPGSRVDLYGLPMWKGQKEPFPHIPGKRGPFFPPQGIVRLRFPDRGLEVRTRGYRGFREPCSCLLSLNKRQRGSHHFEFQINVTR